MPAKTPIPKHPPRRAVSPRDPCGALASIKLCKVYDHTFGGFTVTFSLQLMAAATLLVAGAAAWLDSQSPHERIKGDIIILPVQPAQAVFEVVAPRIITAGEHTIVSLGTVSHLHVQALAVSAAGSGCTLRQIRRRYRTNVIISMFPFDPLLALFCCQT